MWWDNEKFRFWAPVVALGLLAAYSGQKLLRAHIDPDVDSINYILSKTLPATRGTIFDARDRPLVRSIPVWDYHLDPVALTNSVIRKNRREKPKSRAQIVRTIADALKLDFNHVLAMSHNVSKRYQPLATSVDAEAYRVLSNSKAVRGVSIEDKQIRTYLHGRRLSHVLGSVNAEFVGSAGLELKYNKRLTGVPGMSRGLKDANGNELYDKRIITVEPTPGDDIYLTVDDTIQRETEFALKQGVREFGAGSGWCVVMDAKTAAVLSMASLPDFVPQRFGSSSDAMKLNRAVNFTYEPGSVMKVITTASCIDAGFTSPGRMYSTNRNDERYYRLPGDGSHKWEPFMSVADAVVHSSNIVIGKLGYDFGPQRLWKYLHAFGFGMKTGIELPGEEVGILHSWKSWDKASWSRVPIGQAVSVTAIQLVSAYQAIANDGVRMQPHIISRIVDGHGNESYRYVDREVGRPVSATVARTMRNVMLGVASKNGTARRAAIKGYSVAGKTGTAQKVVGRTYAPGLYRATFIGIVPASAPRLVVLVTLDFDSLQKYHQGGNSSAVVFRKLTSLILRYLEIPPDQPMDETMIDGEDEVDQMLDDRAKGAEWCD